MRYFKIITAGSFKKKNYAKNPQIQFHICGLLFFTTDSWIQENIPH